MSHLRADRRPELQLLIQTPWLGACERVSDAHPTSCGCTWLRMAVAGWAGCDGLEKKRITAVVSDVYSAAADVERQEVGPG